ncbi:hypothetical protein AK812_SmicGene36479 [Symbiodinium microadriaticum]|uniref:Uncharacterized protein n=1 Tax=Symbiodinium microadriaticum TaxID=2951 RepID=A0A1Q9CIV7_SYMMI|nr:hypothetical protein AK812_SmicGene36479 [Symbiodinium microadriaticum]
MGNQGWRAEIAGRSSGNTMAAGMTVPYDTMGLQTADLITNQWPLRSGEVRPQEFFKTSHDYGVHIPCHAGQSFQAPCIPAGTSKRMGAFYEKTGVMQHRTEPGFRDKKGGATLTELPMADYGTLRRSTRFPTASTLILDRSAPPLPASERLTISAPSDRPPSDAGSRRSNASKASSRRSQVSRASSQPSWARRTASQQRAQSWNFDALPFYERSNATYGKTWRDAESHYAVKPAGKSESGYVDPQELIATLTRADY